jgi:hypothetical protein
LLISFIAVSPITVNASGDIKILLEGKKISFDIPPQIIEGRTLLPLRAIFEALGLKVGWDNDTKIITGTSDEKTILLKIGDKNASINGITKTLDVPPLIINERTFVPVRFIAESLDMLVDWEQNTRTILIDKNADMITLDHPKDIYNNIPTQNSIDTKYAEFKSMFILANKQVTVNDEILYDAVYNGGLNQNDFWNYFKNTGLDAINTYAKQFATEIRDGNTRYTISLSFKYSGIQLGYAFAYPPNQYYPEGYALSNFTKNPFLLD